MQSRGRGLSMFPPLLTADRDAEKKVPRQPHPHLVRQNSWETRKWSLGTENMGFGVIWAWVRVPTPFRLCDFKQLA